MTLTLLTYEACAVIKSYESLHAHMSRKKIIIVIKIIKRG